MHLTFQQQQVYDLLGDGEYHCSNEINKLMRDYRKRLSELNNLGIAIHGEKCGGRCGAKHSARVFAYILQSEYKPRMKSVFDCYIERDGQRFATFKEVATE